MLFCRIRRSASSNSSDNINYRSSWNELSTKSTTPELKFRDCGDREYPNQGKRKWTEQLLYVYWVLCISDDAVAKACPLKFLWVRNVSSTYATYTRLLDPNRNEWLKASKLETLAQPRRVKYETPENNSIPHLKTTGTDRFVFNKMPAVLSPAQVPLPHGGPGENDPQKEVQSIHSDDGKQIVPELGRAAFNKNSSNHNNNSNNNNNNSNSSNSNSIPLKPNTPRHWMDDSAFLACFFSAWPAMARVKYDPGVKLFMKSITWIESK